MTTILLSVIVGFLLALLSNYLLNKRISKSLETKYLRNQMYPGDLIALLRGTKDN